VGVFQKISTQFFLKRMKRIHAFIDTGETLQKETLMSFIEEAQNTEIGRRYNFSQIKNPQEFQKTVPLHFYEDLEKDILRMKSGEENILWPTSIEFFSKSSGTTGSKSKFIPVSYEFLENGHYRGGKDMISLYCNQNKETSLFMGKTFALGGSLDIDDSSHIVSGDVSAVILHNLPLWARIFRTPTQEIAIMNDWEEKSKKIVEILINEDLRALAGAPAWILAILKKVKEQSGVSTLSHLWPNLEVFFYGGTSIKPFKQEISSLIGKEINYMSIYSASEGFFAIQDDCSLDGDMLLILDLDVVYEFLSFPHKEGDTPIFIGDLEQGKIYELIITTSAGLWRYRIGDLVKITSLQPLRVQIVGRTKQFINVFGEEVMVHNVENALREACKKCICIVHEFTVAPIFQTQTQKGGHQWLIEFLKEPEDINQFTIVLDEELRKVNGDYDAKRNEKMEIMQMLQVKNVQLGTFLKWLQSKDRVGGQYKVPRLSNERTYINEIITLG